MTSVYGKRKKGGRERKRKKKRGAQREKVSQETETSKRIQQAV